MSRFPVVFVFVAAVFAGMTLPLVVMGDAASAKEKPGEDVFTFSDTVFNPCTELAHDVFGTFTGRPHPFELNDPDRHHFNGVFRIELATSDGFSGFAVGGDIDNGAGLFGAEEGRGMVTSHFNAKLRNAAGQIISVHGTFHLSVVGGELVAIVDNFRETCLGKPS